MTDSEAPIKEGTDIARTATERGDQGVEDASKIAKNAADERAAEPGAELQDITKKLKKFGS